MNKNEQKLFEKPTATIIGFQEEDIIVTSGGEEPTPIPPGPTLM